MRIDIDHLTLPEPEAVLLLKDEVRRLRAAIAALADQDATLSVCDGAVTVTMDATLTVEEREAVKYFAAFHQSPREADANAAVTLRKMLERLTSNCPAKPDSWLGG